MLFWCQHSSGISSFLVPAFLQYQRSVSTLIGLYSYLKFVIVDHAARRLDVCITYCPYPSARHPTVPSNTHHLKLTDK